MPAEQGRVRSRSTTEWAVLDELRRHLYDTRTRGSKPDDPGCRSPEGEAMTEGRGNSSKRRRTYNLMGECGTFVKTSRSTVPSIGGPMPAHRCYRAVSNVMCCIERVRSAP